MLTILHISDLHFGPPFLPHVGEALLQIAPTLEPDVIVVSGDFTQRARREQFLAAQQYLKRLPPAPQVVVPGNHDVPLYRFFERMFHPLDLYREYINSDLDHVVHVNGAVIVALNSTSPHRAITNGRIRAGQLEFCERVFQDAPQESARIVVAHHHFVPAPDYDRDKAMPGSKRALERFAELGVDLLLGGHLHRAYVGNSLDIHPGGVRDRGVIIVQCGTSTSRRGRMREREKNSFNVIKLGPQMLHVKHYMYFSDVDAFEPIGRHTFPRLGMRYEDD
ncbi:MAG: metallophosphoesterase [Planctomycetaceae bacterium]|nr:metallophosphoesterase [Planctomycetaceae bacterium]